MTIDQDNPNSIPSEQDGQEPILPDRDGSYDQELKEDPERIQFTVKASAKFVLLEHLSVVAFGAALSVLVWWLLRYKVFTYNYFRYMYLIYAGSALPVAVCFLLSLKRVFPFFLKRFSVSRRFIHQEISLGFKKVDTCDLSKVLDVQLSGFESLFVHITVLTKDKSTPVIRMDYIPAEEGKKLFQFIAAHAHDSFVELRTPRRRT